MSKAMQSERKMWSRSYTYDDWMERQGIPIYRGYYIEDLITAIDWNALALHPIIIGIAPAPHFAFGLHRFGHYHCSSQLLVKTHITPEAGNKIFIPGAEQTKAPQSGAVRD